MIDFGRLIRLNLPPGSPWRGRGAFGQIIDAIGTVLRRLYTYMRGTIAESQPSNAEDTIEEWFNDYGLIFDPQIPLSTQQSQIANAFSAIGGSDVPYLQALIDREFSDVETIEITYPVTSQLGEAVCGEAECVGNQLDIGNALLGICGVGEAGAAICSASESASGYLTDYYRVVGSVTTPGDFRRLQALIDRYFPLHKEPIYEIDILSLQGLSRSGTAVSGLTNTGERTQGGGTGIDLGDSWEAVCGVGEMNAARTGWYDESEYP